MRVRSCATRWAGDDELLECETQLSMGTSLNEDDHVLDLPSGAEVTFGFSRVDLSGDSESRRILGIWSMAGGDVQGEHRLRSRLSKKHPSRYCVDGPFAIAVGSAAHELSSETVKSTLYGFKQVAISADGSHTAAGRDASGFFSTTPSGLRNMDIGGVLVLADVWKALFEAGQDITFYENPHARNRFDAARLGVKRRFEVIERGEAAMTLDWVVD